MTLLDNSVVPTWNEEPSTLDAFEERVILYVLGSKKEERYLCGPRLLAQMDPERQPYKVVKSAVTTTQLAAEGRATLVIAALRRALGARPIQEAVRLFRHLMGLRDMRRQPGESMRKWTSRFEAFIKKTGKALHQADAETTFLHPLIQGILLLECSNLLPAQNAAVLATSGATTKEGGSIGKIICMLIWSQVSLLSGTMRHSCVVTRLHRNVHITLPLQQPRRGICLHRRTLFWNKTLWMVVNWKWHLALVMNPGRPELGRSIWLSGSSRGLCRDGVQECFVRHEKRNKNIYGGQGSGFSSKTRKRLLPCGRSGCFRWFSNNNAERITTDWLWERCEHWNEQPDK